MTAKIGRFEVRGELGRGAQSVVHLGFDPQLQREIAIKTLHFTTSDPEYKGTLLDEARTVSRMRHPSIVPIFEAGEQDGDLYLVFEYVPGKSLADFLRQSRALPFRARRPPKDCWFVRVSACSGSWPTRWRCGAGPNSRVTALPRSSQQCGPIWMPEMARRPASVCWRCALRAILRQR